MTQLCTSTVLRAEDDDDEDHPIIVLTAAEKAEMQIANKQPVPTVALSTHGITPAEFNGDVRQGSMGRSSKANLTDSLFRFPVRVK